MVKICALVSILCDPALGLAVKEPLAKLAGLTLGLEQFEKS